ncbi:MAG: glycosyltransferase [Candidatus Kapabacteria bacterium]|nr:glycosyltransferase [Candidatus Kapabacteria bacterium]
MKTSGLNILIATPHFPFPMIGGERIKLFNLIKHLAKKHNVFLVSFDRGYEVRQEYIDVIKSLGVDTTVFKINHIAAALSAGLFTLFRNPLEIEYFEHSKFRNQINEIMNNHKIDLVLSFFIRTAEHVKKLPVKKILVAEDCRSYYQKRTSESSKKLRQKFIRGYDAVKIARYESDIMNYFDRTTVVTEEDRKQMLKLNPAADIRIISQGVDTDIYTPSIDAKDRNDILFLGKLDVWANILMVNKIVLEIFPLIKKANPGVRLHIAGANPVKGILNFQSESIQIHQNPVDITPFYQKAAVFLHPHSGGSGVQNKVLEAMASGCPVVTSQSGANGINISNGENGYIAGCNEEFAHYTIEMLTNKNQREKVGINARQYVETEKSWESVFKAWDNMIDEL